MLIPWSSKTKQMKLGVSRIFFHLQLIGVFTKLGHVGLHGILGAIHYLHFSYDE